MKKIYDDVSLFLKHRLSYVFFSAMILLMSYGFEITNFTLSNDEELYINTKDNLTLFFTNGRFGIAVFNAVFKTLGMFGPFFSSFVAVTLLFFSATILCVCFQKKSSIKINTVVFVIFTGLYSTIPFVNAEYMCFSTANIQYCFGLCLIACAIYFIDSQTVLSLFCTFSAFSIYQGMISFFVTLSCIMVIFELFQDSKMNFNKYFIIIKKYIGVFFFGLTAYFIIERIIKSFTVQNNYLDLMKGDESYIEAFWHIFERFYLMDNGFGMNSIKYVSAFMLFTLILLFMSNIRQGLWCLLSMMVLLVAPWMTFIAIHTSNVQYRSLFGVQIFVGGGFFLSVYGIWNVVFKEKQGRIINFTKNICYIIACIACIWQAEKINDIFYGDYIRYHRDMSIAENILHDISQKYPDYLEKRIIFTGGIQPVETPAIHRLQVIGMSIFEWEGGNNGRIIPFVNSMGYAFDLPTEEELNRAKELSNNLSIYPSLDSIVCEGDIIVIHTGTSL